MSAKTLRSLERAAMRWYASIPRVSISKPNIYDGTRAAFIRPHQPTVALHRACARHFNTKP